MTWLDTHQRWQALRDVEAAIDADRSGALPWKDEYAEIFGDRAGLLAALRYRWDLMVQAQLDPFMDEALFDERWAALKSSHAGLLRVLQQHERHEAHDEECHLAHAS